MTFDSKTGIEVDRHGATNIRGIYAVGDVTPDSHWTHSADAQGRRVVQRIAFPWLPTFAREPLYPNATFSDPEVANVGLMPEEIAKQYHPQLVKTLRFELPKTDKGYTEGLTRGSIRVSAVRLTGRILGATIVGPRASEMISFFTWRSRKAFRCTSSSAWCTHIPPCQVRSRRSQIGMYGKHYRTSLPNCWHTCASTF